MAERAMKEEVAKAAAATEANRYVMSVNSDHALTARNERNRNGRLNRDH